MREIVDTIKKIILCYANVSKLKTSSEALYNTSNTTYSVRSRIHIVFIRARYLLWDFHCIIICGTLSYILNVIRILF
jgi:hypothetical protein